MNIKITYTNDTERQEAIDSHPELDLLEDAIHQDENYIILGTRPSFDLSTSERAAFTGLIKVINIRLQSAGLPIITYDEMRDAIKAELGL